MRYWYLWKVDTWERRFWKCMYHFEELRVSKPISLFRLLKEFSLILFAFSRVVRRQIEHYFFKFFIAQYSLVGSKKNILKPPTGITLNSWKQTQRKSYGKLLMIFNILQRRVETNYLIYYKHYLYLKNLQCFTSPIKL